MSSSDLHAANLDRYIDELSRLFNVPGISVAIVRLSQESEVHNWGRRSENPFASDENTLYSIASNSKAFAATALGILIDDFQHGRNVTPLPAGVSLDWTTKVADLLPDEWHLQDSYAERHINLLDLLNHVTGMPRHDLSYNLTMDVRGVVSSLEHLRPIAELRERWKYNNMMFGVASYIVQKYSLQSYPDFVASRILTPLGMDSSTYNPQEAFDSGNLSQTWADNAGPGRNETRLIPYWLYDWSDSAISVDAGAGGLISSTKDLSQWVHALLKKGKHPTTGGQIIPASVVETTMLGRTVMEGKPDYPELSAKVYGAGWWRYSYQGHQIVQHSGDVPGYTSLISLLPDDGFGIVTLVNGDEKQIPIECIHFRIMEDELGLKHIDWPDRLSSQHNAEHKALPPIPANQTQSSPLPLADFVGTYSSPGYVGDFTLCTWPSSTDSKSQAVFSAYQLCDPTFPQHRETALYASWRRLWSTHFKLVPDPSAPGRFSMHLDTLLPHGAGEDTSPFLFRFGIRETMVEFEIVDGKVTGLGLWNEPGQKDPVSGRPRERAEAWFDKVT
ncbi:beta-lactamase/transpeptidase-like protein [Calocera viscosa TUFC12733]|uniref:Beta-lactamase/transpeptidase-like protein n=1 Tax=Calocera viscosa (strain TUFC12733) TaxID=1330018 RepID=A0A167SCP4_CALVF|nr:beta-lactamase/transpeptidase-like protein [Calocera viscosa TUFC12733]